MRPPVGAVILCAGASERMGVPKLMLDVGGRTAAEHVAGVALDHLGGPCILVVRSEHAALRDRLAPSDRLSTVVNPNPDLGRTGSIQCGLRALEPSQIMGCLIWPVDLPLVQGATVQKLAAELAAAGPEGRIVPACRAAGGTAQARGGHPVAVGRAWWPRVDAMDPDEPLRNLFAPDGPPGPEVARIEVDDRFIHADLNTPGDVKRWLGREARVWSRGGSATE